MLPATEPESAAPRRPAIPLGARASPRALADLCAWLWELRDPPVIQLYGGTASRRRQVATAACTLLGRPLVGVARPGAVLFVRGIGRRDPRVHRILDEAPGPVLLAEAGCWPAPRRGVVRFDVGGLDREPARRRRSLTGT